MPARPPLVLVLLLLACAGCGPAGPAALPAQAADVAPEPRLVRAAPVSAVTWEHVLRVPGELVALEEATVAAEVAGRVESIAVDLGSRVAAGDVVAQIVSRDHELRVLQAEAALQSARARLGLAGDVSDGDGGDQVIVEETALAREARAELTNATLERDRLAGLLQDGAATQAELDRAVARLATAESHWQAAIEEVGNRQALIQQRRVELELARRQLADTRIRAPFDGAVAARLVGTGDYVSAADPVVRLVRLDPIRLRMDVSERDAPAVAEGQTARIQLAGGATASGPVVRVSPEIGAVNRTLRLEAELDNPAGALRPGSFGQAEIVLDPAATTLVVPPAAIVRFVGIDRVFVVADGRAGERRVTLGRQAPDRVEVLAGLAAGEQVVLAPGSLQDGAPVRVEP